MPIYEFVCGSCGERFERLVAAGTEAASCETCGAAEGRRVLSAQAPTPRLVKTRAEAGRQERRNAALQARSKRAFGQAVRGARSGRSPGSQGG